jgi:hypothetical protein
VPHGEDVPDVFLLFKGRGGDISRAKLAGIAITFDI